jgi:hypothetical protein
VAKTAKRVQFSILRAMAKLSAVGWSYGIGRSEKKSRSWNIEFLAWGVINCLGNRIKDNPERPSRTDETSESQRFSTTVIALVLSTS